MGANPLQPSAPGTGVTAAGCPAALLRAALPNRLPRRVLSLLPPRTCSQAVGCLAASSSLKVQPKKRGMSWKKGS